MLITRVPQYQFITYDYPYSSALTLTLIHAMGITYANPSTIEKLSMITHTQGQWSTSMLNEAHSKYHWFSIEMDEINI